MSVCLTMIVKNEENVISRCLRSVLPHVDGWVIADTGSTDATQKNVAQETFSHSKPGKLLNHLWRDFSTNRNLVLDEAARMGFDYAFIIDADDYIVAERDTSLVKSRFLTHDCYDMTYVHSGVKFTRTSLIKLKRDIKFINPVHEIVYLKPTHTHGGLLHGVHVEYTRQGCRSRDPHVLFKDVELLQRAILTEPRNLRLLYHFAQTQAQLKNTSIALETYKRLIQTEVLCKDANVNFIGDVHGYDVWMSWINVGHILNDAINVEDCISAYMHAFDMKPHRAEPLHYASVVCYQRKLFSRAFMYSAMAIGISKPTQSYDYINLDVEGYAWKFLYQHFLNAKELGLTELCQNIYDDLINIDAFSKRAR